MVQTVQNAIIDFTNLDFVDIPSQVKVAGVAIGDKQSIIANMFVSEPIDLVRDYKNEYDPNAIKVIRAETGEQIGWIPRDVAEILAQYFDAGFKYEAVVENKVGGGDVNYGLRIRLSAVF